jgi:hypothetical protein
MLLWLQFFKEGRTLVLCVCGGGGLQQRSDLRCLPAQSALCILYKQGGHHQHHNNQIIRSSHSINAIPAGW